MTWVELTSKVFSCTDCHGSNLPFSKSESGKFYRFPPTIGAVGQAPLLFVGINPRISNSNKDLHNAIVGDLATFKELSRNRVGNNTYIGTHGLEKHYSLHVRVTKELFPNFEFESVASVTELHYCASGSSRGLPYESSQCAERYFRTVLEVVSPSVVFAVGAHVERTLRVLFGDKSTGIMAKWSTKQAHVITLPHPNSFGKKQAGFNAAVAIAKQHI